MSVQDNPQRRVDLILGSIILLILSSQAAKRCSDEPTFDPASNADAATRKGFAPPHLRHGLRLERASQA
jgi:hypothetical protein